MFHDFNFDTEVSLNNHSVANAHNNPPQALSRPSNRQEEPFHNFRRNLNAAFDQIFDEDDAETQAKAKEKAKAEARARAKSQAERKILDKLKNDLRRKTLVAPWVESIDLRGFCLDKETIRTICNHCPNLKRLNLSGCLNIQPDDLSLISTYLKELTSINLSNCRSLPEWSFGTLASLNHLKSIDLQNTEVGEDKLLYIVYRCPDLKTIRLYGCKSITPSVIDGLKELSKGRNINFDLDDNQEALKINDDERIILSEYSLTDGPRFGDIYESFIRPNKARPYFQYPQFPQTII